MDAGLRGLLVGRLRLETAAAVDMVRTPANRRAPAARRSRTSGGRHGDPPRPGSRRDRTRTLRPQLIRRTRGTILVRGRSRTGRRTSAATRTATAESLDLRVGVEAARRSRVPPPRWRAQAGSIVLAGTRPYGRVHLYTSASNRPRTKR